MTESDGISPIDRLYAIIDRDGIAGLSEAELGYLGIYWFVAETNNGGVDQFFFNDSGRFAAPALHYMKLIGAEKTASVLQRSIALFPDGSVPTDLDERREVMQAMDDRGISFGPLTNELYSLAEDVNDRHGTFALANRSLFSRIWSDEKL